MSVDETFDAHLSYLGRLHKKTLVTTTRRQATSLRAECVHQTPCQSSTEYASCDLVAFMAFMVFMGVELVRVFGYSSLLTGPDSREGTTAPACRYGRSP